MVVCVPVRTCHPGRQAVQQAALVFGLEDVRGRRRTLLLPDEVVEQGLHQPTGQTQTGDKHIHRDVKYLGHFIVSQSQEISLLLGFPICGANKYHAEN